MRNASIVRGGCAVLLSLCSAMGPACAGPDDDHGKESGQKEALEFLARLEAESKSYVLRNADGRVVEVRLGPLHASDEALLHVSRVPTVARLLVGCTKGVTPVGLSAIGRLQALRELELRVEGVNVPRGFMNDLGRMANLEALDVSQMRLADDDVKAISGFPKLKRLKLFNVGLKDSDLLLLKNAKGLVSLDLSQNGLSDQALRSLAPAPTTLRKLRAADVTISEETRKALDGVEISGKSL